MMISKLDVNFIIFHLINQMKYLLLVAFGPLFVKTASPKPVPLTLCPKENYHGLIMVARSTFLINLFPPKRSISVIILFLN